jgi:hypothetical protein
MNNPTILTIEDMNKLAEIQNLLDEGLDHYLQYESHCKSSEGYVSVSLSNSWDRRDGKNPIAVEVYSYALGPNRGHYFDSIDEALEEVRKWHKAEMEYDYEAPEEVAAREELDEMAIDFINQMQEDGRLHIYMIDGEGNELR